MFVTSVTAVIVVHCDHNINQRSDSDDEDFIEELVNLDYDHLMTV